MRISYLLGLLVIGILTTSCSSIKNIKYFKDISDSAEVTHIADLSYTPPKIQPDDILSVNIQTPDPVATQALTQGSIQSSAVGNTSTGSTGGQTITGYLVDSKGNIELPVLGIINVAGITTEQAREVIRTKAATIYQKPSVNLRFANFKVTVFGEVNKPGTYVVSNEKVNVLDALGLAGDLTIYGKRDNITLIRQSSNGAREMVKLDLTKSKILTSPYYYLRQNDYLYIETSKTKVAASDAIQSRNIAIITTAVTALISVIAILISANR